MFFQEFHFFQHLHLQHYNLITLPLPDWEWLLHLHLAVLYSGTTSRGDHHDQDVPTLSRSGASDMAMLHGGCPVLMGSKLVANK